MRTLFIEKIRGLFTARFAFLRSDHPLYKWFVLMTVMIGTFMAVLDATIVNIALPKIMANFGVTIDQIEWVTTAYLLVFSVMLPTSGWLADRIGYKTSYLVGLVLFTGGSFLCGQSWNESSLVLFRIIQGSGAGILMPVGMAIVTHVFPIEQRGLALGFWSIAAAASVSLGPVIGGYLVDVFTWHTIFDVNVPVGAMGMVVTSIILTEYKAAASQKFDYIGFLSMATFLTFLLLALANGNSGWNTGGWTSTFIITCFAVAAVGLIVFLVAENIVKHPLIELKLLANFNFGMTNLVLFLFGLGMFGSTFLLPLYMQNALGMTPFLSGLYFLPVGATLAVFSLISGIVSDKFTPKLPVIIGLIALAGSQYLRYRLSLYTGFWELMIPFIIRGAGMGMLFAPLTTLALEEIPRPKLAQASGLINVIRQVGGSFGVAILATMLTRRVLFHTDMYGQAVNTNSETFHGVMSGLGRFAEHAVGSTPGVAALQAKALTLYHISQQAFVSGIADDFLLSAIATALCIIPVLFLHNKKKQGGGHKPVTME